MSHKIELVLGLWGLPQSNRLSFAVLLKDKVINVYALIDVLGTLPPQSRLEFAVLLTDKVTDVYALINMLGTLPPQSRLEFAVLLTDKVTDVYALINVLEKLPPENRLEFAVLLKDKITCPYHLTLVLEKLPPKNCLEFAILLKNVIKNSTLDSVLDKLPSENRLTLAELLKDKIQDDIDLVDVLEELPPENRLEFAQPLKDKIKNGLQLVCVIDTLLQKDRAVFAGLFIKDAAQLVTTLKDLPKKKRFAFASLLKDTIKNAYQLIRVMHTLPQNNRSEFAQLLIDNIKNNYQLAQVMGALPQKERTLFVGSVITNAEQLMDVLGNLPPEKCLAFAKELIMEDIGWYLANILKGLPPEKRLGFAKSLKDTIYGLDDLTNVLKILPLETRFEFACAFKDRIKAFYHFDLYGTRLAYLLEVLPKEHRLTFAESFTNKILNIQQLKSILQALTLSPSQAFAFVLKCGHHIQDLYIHDLLSKQLPLPTNLYDSPYVQQTLKTGRLSLKPFLFYTAADSQSCSFFDALLKNKSCHLLAYNQRGQTLETIIKGSALTDTEKEVRLASLAVAVEQRRTDYEASFLGVRWGSVIFSSDLRFPEAALPIINEEPGYIIDTIDVSSTHRFHQLCQWACHTEPSLTSAFSALASNTAIRDKRYYPEILMLLECFCAQMHGIRQYQEKPLLFNEDTLDSLSACHTGVSTALNELIFELQREEEPLRALLQTAIHGTGRAMNNWWGIKAGQEVHLPVSAIQHRLGIQGHVSDDPYYIELSDAHLKMWVTAVSRYCTRDAIIDACLSPIDLKPRAYNLDNPEDLRIFISTKEKLFPAADALKTEKQHEFLIRLLSTTSAASAINHSQFTVTDSGIRVLNRMIRRKTEAALVKRGLLVSTDEWNMLKNIVWRALTHHNEVLSQKERTTWYNILTASDGLSLIEEVINNHSDELTSLHLSSFLWTEKEGQSLFHRMASDLHACQWMFGFRLERSNESLHFITSPAPLAPCLANLNSAENKEAREKALEVLLNQRGSLLYWLYHLQALPMYETLFEAVIEVLAIEGFHQFDALPQVLFTMQEKGDKTTHTFARTFLDERLIQQAALGLWDCYWLTISQRLDAQIDWALLMSAQDMAASLQKSENARSFLCLLKTEDHAHLQRLFRTYPRLSPMIIKTFSTVDSSNPAWQTQSNHAALIQHGLFTPTDGAASQDAQPTVTLIPKPYQ